MYVMLSGVSPFLDESEEETSSNILRNDYCFPEEFFSGISSEAKDLMKLILVDDQRCEISYSLTSLQHAYL